MNHHGKTQTRDNEMSPSMSAILAPQNTFWEFFQTFTFIYGLAFPRLGGGGFPQNYVWWGPKEFVWNHIGDLIFTKNAKPIPDFLARLVLSL